MRPLRYSINSERKIQRMRNCWYWRRESPGVAAISVNSKATITMNLRSSRKLPGLHDEYLRLKPSNAARLRAYRANTLLAWALADNKRYEEALEALHRACSSHRRSSCRRTRESKLSSTKDGGVKL